MLTYFHTSFMGTPTNKDRRAEQDRLNLFLANIMCLNAIQYIRTISIEA